MSTLPPTAGEQAALEAGVVVEEPRWVRVALRADRLASGAARRPYRSTLAILAINMALTALFIPLGIFVFDDPAELFRELMPGTWLSFAELLFVAAIAWAVHRRLTGSRRLRLDNFWALSAIAFLVFAIVEIGQPTIFLSHLLTALGALAPQGFRDLDAFLLTVLFLAAGAALLRYLPDILSCRPALVLLGIGVLLGAAMQTLDSTLPATSSEFVAEESLKLAAEPFLIGGYLLALRGAIGRSAGPGSRRLDDV